jgi:acetyl esterase/lipase
MVKFLASCLVSLVVAHAIVLIAQTNPPFRLPDSVRMLPDVLYNQPDRLRLDLFSPEPITNPAPAILFVVCGGWRGGIRSNVWRQAVYLAERGVIAAVTDCRPAPASQHPTQLNDAVSAIAWLRAHAKDYKIDPETIAVAGASAGGHLAALVGMNRWNGSDWSGAPPQMRVIAVVAFNAVLDVPRFGEPDAPAVPRTNLSALLGSAPDRDPERWRAASPRHHVTPAAAPFLLLHGTHDEVVPYAQSVDMQRVLREAGVEAELFTADGGAHGFFNSPPWYGPTTTRMGEFLMRIFKR